MIRGKGIIIATIAIIGTGFVIVRFFRNQLSGDTLMKTLRRLNQHPEKATDFAAKLECFLGRYETSNPNSLRVLTEHFRSNPLSGKYKIHGVFKVPEGGYLLVTECKDEEYSMNAAGMATVEEVFQINFLIKYKAALQQVVIYSHQYTNREEERLLKAFSKDAFEILQQKALKEEATV